MLHATGYKLPAIGATIFVLTWLLRFLSLNGFPDDHFLYLAPAQQMLAGEWPSKDFVDPGTPLMYAVSAAARVVVDPPLLAETIVVSTAFGLAAALTLYAAFFASRSLTLAAGVALAQVAMFPRSYHYPKLLLYALGILAMWHYLASPSRCRAAALAACVVVAFLFRHDHGVVLGFAAVITAALTGGTPRARAGRVIEMAALTALVVLPYLLWVAANTGLVQHFASGLEYSRAEADRTALGFPPFDAAALLSADNIRTSLFYLFHLLPFLALPGAIREPRMIPVVFLACVANVTLLRDPLQGRLPDAAVPAAVLGAWLIARAWQDQAGETPPPRARRALVAIFAAILLAGINVVGSPREQLNRAGLSLRPTRWPSIARERLAELQAPFARRQIPSQYIEDLVPFLEYVQRCTAPTQRLFVAGDASEIYVYARRLFAGGQPILRNAFFGTDADQYKMIERIRGQDVPLIVVLAESDTGSYPVLMAELDAMYHEVVGFPIVGQGIASVRVRNGLPARRTDAATGLPCFV